MKTNDSKIASFAEDFAKAYMRNLDFYKKYDMPEIDQDFIESLVNGYLEQDSLTKAKEFVIYMLDMIYPEKGKIEWGLDREILETTEPYIEYRKRADAEEAWYMIARASKLENFYVEIHGPKRTDEEAAKIAADIWCEKMFGYYLQDNGAINESHAGGFYACALGTILKNDSLKSVTDDMKENLRNNLKDFYWHAIHYYRTHDTNDIKWCEEKFPDLAGEDSDSIWRYAIVGVSLSVDYHPSMLLYLIIVNSGIPENVADLICPWKTTVSVRVVDGTVFCNRKEI